MLTVRQFAGSFAAFRDQGVSLVRVFHSPLFALEAVFGEEPPPFPILADPDREVYRAYRVERGLKALLKPAARHRVRESRDAKLKPRWRDAIRDGFTGLPADFLVGPAGTLVRVRHGVDFTDSLTVQEAMEWVQGLTPS